MHSPIETIKGKIVDYNPKTSVMTIEAVYPDWRIMLKREFKTCLVQPIDSRPISDKQRRACYALLREIADYAGESMERTKELFKLKFLAENIEATADNIFSLSNAPMSLVCEFQRYLVRTILDWDIPCSFPLLNFVDDIGDYVYGCLINKKCCVCGKKADLHHHDRIGTGRNRDTIDHEGMLVMPLCREHHTEAHTMGQKSFDDRYHVIPVLLDKTLMKIWRVSSGRKRYDK